LPYPLSTFSLDPTFDMQQEEGVYGYSQDAIHVVDMHTTGEVSAQAVYQASVPADVV
jgi:hypothetical protein